MTAYLDALRRLYGLAPRGIRLDLDRVRLASLALGHPGNRFPSVHIAGTNGKGSVAAMVDSILRAAGYRVGLYTSPHLHRFTERIRIADRQIAQGAVVRGLREIDQVLRRPGAPELTFFEVGTLLALSEFARQRVDVAVVEVGLGGRLDATQLVQPIASVITRIGLDHCDRLGSSLAQVAREKAGIVRRLVPVIAGITQPELRRSLGLRCKRLGATLELRGRDFDISVDSRGLLEFSGRSSQVGGLRLGLGGQYQIANAAIATATALRLDAAGLRVPGEAIRQGLQRTRWPGRFERIGAAPSVLLDVAHNPDGAEALADAVRAEQAGPVELVFGVLGDKDADGMLRSLKPLARHIIFTRPMVARARDPEELSALHGGEVVASVARAVSLARRRAGARGRVLVTGSIFTVAEARAALLGRRVRAEPPITL